MLLILKNKINFVMNPNYTIEENKYAERMKALLLLYDKEEIDRDQYIAKLVAIRHRFA